MTKYRGKESERRRGRMRDAHHAHPERRKARHAVAAALKHGALTCSDKCSSCGMIKPTVAHHWSYELEHWLNVVWMCRRCHQKHTM